MLLQKQQIEDAVLSNPALNEFMDAEGTEPELAADVIDLVKTFPADPGARAHPADPRSGRRDGHRRPDDPLPAPPACAGRSPDSAEADAAHVQSRQALVCMFLALLELVRLQAIQVRQDHVFGEVLVRKHSHFEAVMTEQAAVRDDWR